MRIEVLGHLRSAGHEVVDFGAHTLDPHDDYPDFVIPLARAVVAGAVERGVAISGSGVGASVCANKVPGIRAALIHDHFSAKQGVEDDHMNVLWTRSARLEPHPETDDECHDPRTIRSTVDQHDPHALD